MTVGFLSGLVQDDSRTDWDGTGFRPISWAAWYPATADAREAPMRFGGHEGPWFDVGTMAQGALLVASTARMPVVLVSHGTGGTAASLGWIGRRLAEHGFVVLGANHHGNTAVEPYRPEGFLCWWERARDLSALLDHLDHEGPFASRLDMERVFAVGFSLGCHTALSLIGGITDMERFRAWAERSGGPLARGPREFPDLADRFSDLIANRPPFQASWHRRGSSYRDLRVRAALLLAPAPPVRALADESLAAISAPVCMMIGGADVEAPVQDRADWLAERLANSRIEHFGPDVGRYAFLPEATDAGRSEAPELCADAPAVNRRTIHERTFVAARRLFGGATS